MTRNSETDAEVAKYEVKAWQVVMTLPQAPKDGRLERA